MPSSSVTTSKSEREASPGEASSAMLSEKEKRNDRGIRVWGREGRQLPSDQPIPGLIGRARLGA